MFNLYQKPGFVKEIWPCPLLERMITRKGGIDVDRKKVLFDTPGKKP
jgi:hypothetical protein